MIFGRKKTEKPKNVLGIALYEYDIMLAGSLKSVMGGIQKNKVPSLRRSQEVIFLAAGKSGRLIEDISRTNFKTDYRSDKARESIIAMISGLRQLLEDIGQAGQSIDSGGIEKLKDRMEKLQEERKSIKKKMKDIESDYL